MTRLVDEALSMIYEVGTIDAMKWLYEAAKAEEREVVAQSLDKQADLASDEIDRQWAQEMAAAVRARSNK